MNLSRETILDYIDNTGQTKRKQQIKLFDNITGDNVSECNLFLKEKNGSYIFSANYNSILGGMIYVVVFYE